MADSKTKDPSSSPEARGSRIPPGGKARVSSVVGLSLLGAQRGLFPLWAAGLAFSPFIVDATWTLFRRLSSGEHLW